LKRLNRFRGTGSSFHRSAASPAKPSIGVKLYLTFVGEELADTEFRRAVGFGGFGGFVFRFKRFELDALFVFGFDNLFGGRRDTGADCSLPITTVI
jgi:hypothetical protein